MSLKKPDYTGQEQTISMMELRSQPGFVMDCVALGMTIHVEKNGKRIATITPSETVINSDGTYTGARPLTMGRPELLRD